MNPDYPAAIAILIGLALAYFGGRRAWREWTGWYLR